MISGFVSVAPTGQISNHFMQDLKKLAFYVGEVFALVVLMSCWRSDPVYTYNSSNLLQFIY